MYISSFNQGLIWFDQAKWDLEASKISRQEGFYEWSCFEAQQSAEKSIKAVIVAYGVKAPRTHKLSSLIGMMKDLDKKIMDIYFDVRTLQAFTFIARYPFLVPDENNSPHNFITSKDSEKCINQAEQILNTLQSFYKN
jgi:HEPN domain-containing protein